MLAKLTAAGHHISNNELRKLADKGLRAISRLNKATENAREQFGMIIGAAEVSASAFAFGFARGYWATPGQDVEIMGVPVDLAGAAALHALGLFGDMGHYAGDCANLGNGGLASYFTTLGMRTGVEQRQKHPPSTPAATAGWMAGGMMHPNDLASFVATAR